MPERLSTKKAENARLAKPAAQPAARARAVDLADLNAASPAQLRLLNRAVGNRALNRMLAAKTIQAKLTVGPAGDRYEQEADRSAEAVMRMAQTPAPAAGQPAEEGEPLRRQALEDEEPVQRQALEDEEPLQRQPAAAPVGPAGGEAGPAVEAKLAANRGAGAPLPEATRAKMETGLGADFSGVRIHTGAEAANLNQELGAQAFTHGADVYLGAGQYAPNSSDGQRLLAHELTHVVQQGASTVRRRAKFASQIQRYTTIPPQASQTASSAFQPTLSGDAIAGYKVSYRPVNVAARPLNLSESGAMAIYDGAEAQVRSFFVSPAVLAQSNADLERTNAKVRLVPTGGSVVIQTAHTQAAASLLEVEADVSAYRDASWQTNSLFTQCKKFVQHVNPKVGGYEEAFRNEAPDALSDTERQALDERLRDLRLAAGDAFQIASAGKESKKGWNEHYAGIVAVDGEDHVTLENFNRDAEARGLMDADKAELARTVMAEIDELRKALAKSSFTNIKSNYAMRKKLAALNERLKVYVSVETKGTRDATVTTHYFKMFGPARSQQSFLDVNMGDMDSPISKLKVARGGQPGERPTVKTEE